MSLFAAYCDPVNKQDIENVEKNQETTKDKSWLNNSSYLEISTCLHSSTDNKVCIVNSEDEDSDDTSIVEYENETAFQNKKSNQEESNLCKQSAIHNEKKSTKVDNRKGLLQYETQSKNLYFKDKERNKIFCTLNKLEHSMRPNYTLSNKKLGFKSIKLIRRKRFQRYHIVNLDVQKKVKTDSVIKREKNVEDSVEKTDFSKNSKLQDEQKVVNEEFNKKITEFPRDVDLWLKYASFQDEVIQLSSFYCDKEHLAQVRNKKKLSIIEKGLTVNHNSIELLKMKLSLMSDIVPADEFCSQVETMIKKDQRNIILWQALIKVTQTSCALCNVSKILDLYVKCFSVLKQKPKLDPKYYDNQVLGLLMKCLIFLRHAGLWEQMWEIIRINLCLNLSLQHETLKDVSRIDEKILISMEEIILASKLPLNQLWLRVESLRESCHWTSVDLQKVDINLIGDERRLVSAEETADFIYPTIARESNFRLVVLSLLCLKVPLLPSRHCTMENLGLDEYYWSVDSLEFILPMIYSTICKGELDNRFGDQNVIADLLEGKLTAGPQFLKFHPAQESFLDFIRSVFNTISETLPAAQRTSILIWWLRLERLLIVIAKSDPLCEVNRNKKLKSLVKNFLKKPENRNNLHFYREFAMIEYELGSFHSSIQILKTVIQSQDNSCLGPEEKAALFSLYRTFFEFILDSNYEKNFNLDIFQDVIKTLKSYVSTCFSYNTNISVEEMLYNEILKFLMHPLIDEPEDAFFLPNIHCDILLCYAYLLHYQGNRIDDINDILDLFDKCLIHCNKCFRLQERFYETKVVFLQFCQYKVKNIKNILMQTINAAIDKYSSNFFFLSINALVESELPIWKLKTKSTKLNIWSILASCLAGRARITYLRNIGLEDTCQAMINKMLSFHKTMSNIKEVQNCPLVWKFYMLLLQEHNLCEKKGEEIYYEAITQCPWARSVYMSAAEVAPQNLPQIQDLIKEKGLRMHVTLEELDILRE